MQQLSEELIEKIKLDLANGITRFREDDKGYGSIEEKYTLTRQQIRKLFKFAGIRYVRTKIPVNFPVTGLSVVATVDKCINFFKHHENKKTSHA